MSCQIRRSLGLFDPRFCENISRLQREEESPDLILLELEVGEGVAICDVFRVVAEVVSSDDAKNRCDQVNLFQRLLVNAEVVVGKDDIGKSVHVLVNKVEDVLLDVIVTNT